MARRLPIVEVMAQLLRLIGVCAAALVLLGFAAFASDEAGRSRNQQVAKLGQAMNDPAPPPSTERQREGAHGKPRELIDDSNDVLLSPFAGLTDSDNPWARRGIPTLLALLLYGGGLTLVANALPKAATRTGDWRIAR